MANKILTDVASYESIRRKLGANAETITDQDIEDMAYLPMAEAKVIKLVPDYASIVDETELMFLKSAVVSQTASLLCPLMATRYKYDVKTIDASWKKEKVDWAARATELQAEMLTYLQHIESVVVVLTADCPVMVLAKSARALEQSE